MISTKWGTTTLHKGIFLNETFHGILYNSKNDTINAVQKIYRIIYNLQNILSEELLRTFT